MPKMPQSMQNGISKPLLRRLEQAWADEQRSLVVSESVYDFDLDECELKIQDRDFIFVSASRSGGIDFPGGKHVIKRIRPAAKGVVHSFSILNPDFSHASVTKGTPVSQVSIGHEENGGLIDVILNTASGHKFEAGTRYRVDIQYTVPLGKLRAFFFSHGSVQPSDYKVARNVLKVDSASKSVTLVVRRKSDPFVAYVFDGGDANYSPCPLMSEIDANLGNCVHHHLTTSMDNFERARYFTFAVNLL